MYNAMPDIDDERNDSEDRSSQDERFWLGYRCTGALFSNVSIPHLAMVSIPAKNPVEQRELPVGGLRPTEAGRVATRGGTIRIIREQPAKRPH
jgi:hypothetical protein